MKAVYSVIVPVYNEEEVIDESYKRLINVLNNLDGTFELIYINDGSRDASEQKILNIIKNDQNVRLINFSRNFGHQSAISAGMDFAKGNAVIVIDADLQDPPEVIPEMIKKWKEGYEVVYGKRKKRTGETVFKKATASMFYRLLRKLTDVDIPIDAGDFRLIDRKVCDAMKSLKERNRYIRGLVSWVGYKQTFVEYDRDKRFAGETKYPLKRMVKLAADGITSFSHKPLKLAISFGFFLALLSFIYMLVVVYQRIFTNTTITGWSSTIIIILFTQGVVLMVLGLIGEYIGRIYDEIKERPVYIVDEVFGYDSELNEINNCDGR